MSRHISKFELNLQGYRYIDNVVVFSSREEILVFDVGLYVQV